MSTAKHHIELKKKKSKIKKKNDDEQSLQTYKECERIRDFKVNSFYCCGDSKGTIISQTYTQTHTPEQNENNNNKNGKKK